MAGALAGWLWIKSSFLKMYLLPVLSLYLHQRSWKKADAKPAG